MGRRSRSLADSPDLDAYRFGGKLAEAEDRGGPRAWDRWRPACPPRRLGGLAERARHRRLGPDTTWHRWFLGLLPAARRAEYRERSEDWAEIQLSRMPPAPTTSPAEAEEEEEDGDRLMPTRLGNTLRTMEDDAEDRFGLDAVAVAPYLLQVASPDMVFIYEDARTELDVTVKFVYVWMACTVIGFVAFLSDGIWMVVPVVTLFLAWMSYRASIVAARGFGDVLAELVRLYRFDLMTKLHWRLPWHLEEEVEQNKVLWRLLAGVPEEGERRLRYQHPMES